MKTAGPDSRIEEDSSHSVSLISRLQSLRSEPLDKIKEFFSELDYSALMIKNSVMIKSIREEAEHILRSRTKERAMHYFNSIERILDGTPTGSIRKDSKYWKGYDQIITDSLWILGNRARESLHKGWYWGNFVPQIPYQLISRFTDPGDWILDPFCGSGTSIIEAMRLSRNAVGIEINQDMVSRSRELIERVGGAETKALIFHGDSRHFSYAPVLANEGIMGFSLAILHPPYHDIIKFSDIDGDLSGAKDVDEFLAWLGMSLDRVLSAMLPNSTISLVIGDIYKNGEVVPLGFLGMELFRSRGLVLKGIVIKDIQNNRAKRNSEALWRYRALRGGFYVFKHEYIFVFKTMPRRNRMKGSPEDSAYRS